MGKLFGRPNPNYSQAEQLKFTNARQPKALPTAGSFGSLIQVLKTTQQKLKHVQNAPSAPGVPQNFSVTGIAGGIQLSWGQVIGADGYLILRSATADFSSPFVIKIAHKTQTFYLDAVGGGQTFYYRVVATAGTVAQPQITQGSATATLSATSLASGTDSNLDQIADGVTYARRLGSTLVNGTSKRQYFSAVLQINSGAAPTYFLPLIGQNLTNYGTATAAPSFANLTGGSVNNAGESLSGGDAEAGTYLVNSVLSIPASNPTHYTVGGWFQFGSDKLPAANFVLIGSQNVLPSGTASGFIPILWVDVTGTLYAAAYDGAAHIITCPFIPDWRRAHHIMVNRTTTSINLFVDGVWVAATGGLGATQAQPYFSVGGGYSSSFWNATLFPTSGWYGSGTSIGVNVQDFAVWENVDLAIWQVKKLFVAGNGQKITDFAAGTIPPQIVGGISWTTATTSITFSGSPSILRVDNTTTATSPAITGVTGLAASTTYYFYPYFNDQVGNTTWTFISGSGHGSPAVAWTARSNSALQLQNQWAFVPFNNGALAIATPASGSGGGSGGGSGSCVRRGMLVETRERGVIAVEELKEGEHLLRADGGWTKVILVKRQQQETWIRVTFSNGEYIDSNPTHVYTLADGSDKQAQQLTVADVIPAREGYVMPRKIEVFDEDDYKVAIACEDPYVFLCGAKSPTVQTHNVQIT